MLFTYKSCCVQCSPRVADHHRLPPVVWIFCKEWQISPKVFHWSAPPFNRPMNESKSTYTLPLSSLPRRSQTLHLPHKRQKRCFEHHGQGKGQRIRNSDCFSNARTTSALARSRYEALSMPFQDWARKSWQEGWSRIVLVRDSEFFKG